MKARHHHQPKVSRPDINFTEVAVANVGPFQIVVPTATRMVNQPFFSGYITVPKRDYHHEGWVIYQNKIASHLFALDIGEILINEGQGKPVKRIAPAVPIGFETHGNQTLPLPILEMASFSYQFEDDPNTYTSVFRKLRPRFTRVYPIKRLYKRQILGTVKQLLTEESQFIVENHERLKQNPFYREKFQL